MTYQSFLTNSHLKKGVLTSLLLGLMIFSSCSKYQKVLKSANYDKKYDAAVVYFEKKDYFRASSLFEELLPVYKGTRKAETVLHSYATCQYEMGEYLMAAYYFENFVKTYPNSEFSEDSYFKSANCYYQDSPVYSLDQTNTYKAIAQIEIFVNKFPQSALLVQCHEMLDVLRLKLETKALETARLYLNMEDYKASISEFHNLLKDFPDTKFREEALFLTLKANYLYAINSVKVKQKDRLQAAVESYTLYKVSFPAGEFSIDSQNIYENTIKQIDKLVKENS